MFGKSVGNPLLAELTDGFSLDELKTLCLELAIDFDDLPGDGKVAKARELLLEMQRRHELDKLVTQVVAARPDATQHLIALPTQRLRLTNDPPWRAWPWFVQAGLAAVLFLALAGIVFGAYSYWINKPDVSPAQAGEVLVLISAFRAPNSAATLLPEQRIDNALRALKSKSGDLNVRVALVPSRVIASEQEAREWGRRHGAKLVIWGWYDAEGVEVKWTLPSTASSPAIGEAYSYERSATDAPVQLAKLLPERVGLVSQIMLGWLAFLQHKMPVALAIWDDVIAAAKSMSLEQQRALKLDEVLYLHGIAARQLGHRPQAQDDFARAEEINPQNYLAVYQNAEVAYANKSLSLAQTKVQQVIDATPASADPLLRGYALRLAARIKRDQGQLGEATLLAEQSVEVAPQEPTLWVTLSDLYLKQRNWQKAADAATAATRLPSVHAFGYFNLGRAQIHLGDARAATAAYAAGVARLDLKSAEGKKALTSAALELSADAKNFPELSNSIQSILASLQISNP